VRIGLLGAVEAWQDDAPLDLGPRRGRFLLAVLALSPGRAVGADRLIELCWPDAPPANPRASLQVAMSRLRAGLGPAAPVEGDRFGYRLNLEPAHIDAIQFEQLIAEARSSKNDERAVELLQRAEDLWRGPALADVGEDNVRERLCRGLMEHRISALEERADALLRLGRHTEPIAELRAVLESHPTRERVARELMIALYRSGQANQALAVAGQFRERLIAEFGLDPSPELEQLQVGILRNDATLTNPMSSWDSPAQLPPRTVGFAGRISALRTLDRQLDPADALPIITIVGTGGAGKTALAVRWAHSVSRHFPDGQLYVDLRGYSAAPSRAPLDVLAQFLRALGVPADRVPVDIDEAAALFRSRLAERRVLVLLDNADSSDQVRPLLPGSDGCLVLVTSRDNLTGLLSTEGARSVALGLLQPDEAHHLLAGVLGASRLAAEPGSEAELARLCGYLPLALRIAAAGLSAAPELSISSYVTELAGDDRLAALTADESVGVRATFELSYRKLNAPEQRMFRLLGLIPGPDFSAATAAALADVSESQARVALRRLCSAHLLNRSDSGRYAFHDLLRLYAAETVQSDGERKAALTRLLNWYFGHAEAACRLLFPQQVLPLPDQPELPNIEFADRAAAMQWLDADLPNLSAAVQHATELGFPAMAWLITNTLRRYLLINSLAGALLTLAEYGVKAARSTANIAGEAAMELALAGAIEWNSGASNNHLRHAQALAHKAGCLSVEAAAATNFASVLTSHGPILEAIQACTIALQFAQDLDRSGSEAVNLNNLGVLMLRSGNLTAAEDYFERALQRYRSFGAYSGEARAVNGRGNILQVRGRFDEALECSERSQSLSREIGDRDAELVAVVRRADIFNDRARYEEARQIALVCRERAVNDPFTLTQVLGVQASSDRALGHREEAIAVRLTALKYAQQCRSLYFEAVTLSDLAADHLALGQPDEALRTAGRALAISRTQGLRAVEGAALNVRAQIQFATRALDQAVRDAQASVEIGQSTGHRLVQARALATLADALTQIGADPTMIERHRRTAFAIFDGAGMHEAAALQRL
jgi:DNA-binding SARP family transcriptional activator